MVLRETVQAAKTQVHHIAGGRGDPLYGFTEERKSPTIHNDSQWFLTSYLGMDLMIFSLTNFVEKNVFPVISPLVCIHWIYTLYTPYIHWTYSWLTLISHHHKVNASIQSIHACGPMTAARETVRTACMNRTFTILFICNIRRIRTQYIHLCCIYVSTFVCCLNPILNTCQVSRSSRELNEMKWSYLRLYKELVEQSGDIWLIIFWLFM